jgi:phage head maturation protease
MSKKLEIELIGGGGIKADGANRFSGYGILFTDQFSPDCDQEFFNDRSDFWLEDRVSLPVLYEHGRDPSVGKQRLGSATWSKDDRGVFFAGELYEAEHADEIMRLVETESLGFSTGALSPWVEREKLTFATWLKTWPVYELSLTSRACERRTVAQPLKSYRPAPLHECDSLTRFERERQRTKRLMLRAIEDQPEQFSEADRRRWGADTNWLREQHRKRAESLRYYGDRQAEAIAEAGRLKSRFERLVAEQEFANRAAIEEWSKGARMKRGVPYA